MLDFRPITYVNGILLATLATAMMLPALVDLALGNPDWIVFATAGGATLFVGLAMTMATRGSVGYMNVREAFVMTALAWVLIAFFAALPLVWSELSLSLTDAYFETIAGLTTTGATVISGLDNAPPGILLWRGLLQWLGGLGIIVMAIAVLPMLQVGGMQLFRIEAFDTSEKVLPRATQISGSLTSVYVIITVICAIAYHLAGMDVLDAAVHSMTTIATGGFSSHDASMGYFESTPIEIIGIIFMIVGSLPFLLYITTLQGHRGALLRDSQVRLFFAFVVIFSRMALLAQGQSEHGIDHGLREAVFNVVSIMTGTGYSTVDYDLWGPFAVTLFLCLTFVGGCAGSTSCGIKVFRFQVLYANISQHLKRILHPHGVFVNMYNGRPLADHVSGAVMCFFFFYFLAVGVVAIILTFSGLDVMAALSASATTISKVGPGLGPVIGPAGNFSSLTDFAKWVLSGAMLMGRLELFTVPVLLLPSFWRH